jgi:hypothetical protein
MIHFTMTGYMAGIPFCAQNKNDKDKYIHVPYNWNDEVIVEKAKNGEVCQACANEWIEAGK